MPDLYRAADCFVLPSIATPEWQEQFGMSLIEAMACGTPVIACNKGSVSEVIDFGKTGFYAETVEELASLVSRAILLDRRTVREHAMERFSVKRMVDEYLKSYESLVLSKATYE